MDQAQQLRNVIKQRNQNYIEPAVLLPLQAARVVWANPIPLSIWQSGSAELGKE